MMGVVEGAIHLCSFCHKAIIFSIHIMFVSMLLMPGDN
jgi:hypothetical protein